MRKEGTNNGLARTQGWEGARHAFLKKLLHWTWAHYPSILRRELTEPSAAPHPLTVPRKYRGQAGESEKGV